MSNTRLVILFLGAIVLLDLAGMFTLAFTDRSIPDVMVGLATGGLGSLGTLLVNSRGTEPPSAPGTP